MGTSLHDTASILAAIGGLWLAALIAPGPDFLLVTRISLTRGRAASRRAALGVAAGIAAWGLAGFFGVNALFLAAPWLYLALKLGGGAYLAWLGVRLLVGSFRPVAAEAPSAAPGRGFRTGLLTNLANPKAPLFVSGLFAATLPPHATAALGLAAVALMFALTLLWYTLVGRALTIHPLAGAFTRARRWIDRAAGTAFLAFGTKLLFDRRA
jgi:threonine/homoserine/homoserine lactone efflux protein